ncbi:MAG TPA: glycosyltransferase [Chthonomonadales bacterium]|nr:glycosyltransferase [Chthonomonadales bacterium]
MTVSVVIASYNHARFLRQCVESALTQTTPPIEVIVVDDGSTDGSRDVIRSFGRAVKPLFQENAGTYAALNAGAALAKGDWIAIHNSDDAWDLRKLERQMELCTAEPAPGLIHTGYLCIDENGIPYSTPPANASLPDYHGPALTGMLPTMLRSMPVVISSAMISRTAWERFGPFDRRYLGMGDWDLCLKVSQEFPFGFVDAPLTLVRKHSANAGTDATRIPSDWTARDWRLLGLETMPAAAQSLFETAKRNCISKQEAAFGLACLATIYSWGHEPALARRVYLLAARLNPLRAQTYLRFVVTYLPQRVRVRIR